MCEIKICDQNRIKTVLAESGTRLSDILAGNGFFIDMPCGGSGTCGKCAVTVNGKEEPACRYVINKDITVVLPENRDIVSDDGNSETTPNGKMCFALDIGTTTLALALVSLNSGKAVRVMTCVNSQRMSGADVMSRIEYCRKNGVEKLHKAVIRDINGLIERLDIKEKIPLFVAGNTTMLHIFFGVDCSPLGTAPYTPAFIESQRADGSSLGIENVSEVIS
ncbi:MAG: 2Fe-2S iron-sulfur cluster binding domain-containing protein, partial [Clostridia bacterium]|nr:2Fe-2S iron-sulfur cluster binding domain-containing protein [Clostridia bacterium]